MNKIESDQLYQISEAILSSVRRERAVIDLYTKLAEAAPTPNHKRQIAQALQHRNRQLNQFMNLYVALTGNQPDGEIINHAAFGHYLEGLNMAYESGIEGYKTYQEQGSSYRNPAIQEVFVHAATSEIEYAERFGAMHEEVLTDQGMKPFVVDIEKITKQNDTFRTAIWTGKYFQVTLMSIDVGSDIGLEVHPKTDQFIRIEEGEALVQMGDTRNNLSFVKKARDDDAIMIPAGKWHNVTNTGNKPLKVYVIYAPPEHPFGTVHETKAAAMAAEEYS
ncbi:MULTISPECIES: cupin domain-containing protein [Paenibacillus]|uniref:Mannose-6-phosphate isomerase-like protein (Cupin superfamily) n=1 Tax=Paenibacillus lactis TaxID=228574 RepID=A0ABS4FAU4_9BACL|nr:cupin domain-containing protein [Paenibacillus lactis]MBP1893343.1 mannose-6-phosphate isomerase-like protein (cupin superfamily) [Paenibacillus lactis]MCM3496344.1 cupin domain-containing protein [Paenibacillus lactis]HAG01403.1 cupin domain-containing protein [Paenibacillus lactis]